MNDQVEVSGDKYASVSSSIAIAHGRIDELVQRLDSMAEPTEPNNAEIYTALAKAQLEIQNPEKDATNPHFGSDYATLASIMDAVREPLAKNGLALMQLPLLPETGGELRLETRLTHTSGQSISSIFVMHPVKMDPQGIGSCMTYMRKYAAAAICGIAQVDDDGERTRAKATDYERITVEEVEKVLVTAHNLFGSDDDAVVARMLKAVFTTSELAVSAVSDLPAGCAEQAITALENQAKREKAATKKASKVKEQAG